MNPVTTLVLAYPDDWKMAPLWAVAPRTRDSGQPHLQPLSVFLGEGVVPRAERTDNHNRLGIDLGKYLHVRPGNLVFNKLRTWQGGLGVSRHEGIVSPAYFVCRPTSHVSPQFLHYLLRSKPYLAELTRLSKWMPPSQFDIAWNELRRLPILLPPMEEQRRIADFLDDHVQQLGGTDRVRAQQQALLAERRAALIRVAVVGVSEAERWRAVALPWVRFLPQHWDVAKLTRIARLGSGHTPSRSRQDWWTDRTIPWITTGEVAQMREDRVESITETREKISELGLANSAAELHPRGTVVLCRTASAGYSAVMGVDMATSQDFATWTCGPRLDPYYLLWTLRAMRPYLLGALAIGSTHKTIYMPDIEALQVPLPPIKEQRSRISDLRVRLTALDQAWDALRRQRDLLAERRTALITAAVTGRIDVTTARGVA